MGFFCRQCFLHGKKEKCACGAKICSNCLIEYKCINCHVANLNYREEKNIFYGILKEIKKLRVEKNDA